MRKVHRDLRLAVVGLVVLLGVFAGATGLTAVGWVVGLAYGGLTYALLLRGCTQAGSAALGPADRVTLTRTVLVGAIAALVAEPSLPAEAVAPLVALVGVALALDGVDGWVARRTRTVSALGARFDMEVDAFLILVLSLHVAGTFGVWVLAIGAARYLFVAAGWVLSWMRVPLPFRYWRKVVAAIQGVTLTVATVDLLPHAVAVVALLIALVLLGESFGRDVWWLWRSSRDTSARVPRVPAAVTEAAPLE